MPDTITITDDRTGKTVTVPITDGVFPSSALRELDPSLFMYDPAYLSTAACASSITYLDGDAGILRYRGYPIEQLAEHSTYLEVAYLLLNGELPNKAQLEQWNYDVTHHTFIHENMRKRFVDGFHYDAHPMGMFISAVAALGTFYEDAKEIHDPESRNKQILRLIAKMPTLAAMCYRFSVGLPFVYPNNDISFPANFLNMMWKVGDYEIDPRLERAMEVLFILHADHEQNCGTTAMRVVGSSHADPYSACAAAAAALYGPLHGGANEQVVRMLQDIGSLDNVPAFIDEVKSGKGSRLMGFGHRVYKNYDPRATHHQEGRRRRVRGHRQEPAARHRPEAGGGRPLRLLLRRPQAVPQRRLLLGPDLPGDGLPGRHVHRAVRHPPHVRLAGPLDGTARRQGTEDLPPAPVVHRRRRARLHRPRRPRLSAMELAAALKFAREHRQGVLITLRADGRPQSSNIIYAVDDDGALMVSMTDDRAKTKNLRRDPRCTMHINAADFWSYVVLDGKAELTPVTTDPHDATADALVEVYRAVAGEHPDWEEYRRAMVSDRRLVLTLRPDAAYGMVR